MLFAQPTCGSIFTLTTSMNMLQWRLKTELHRPTSRINRLIIGKQTIMKLSTIVSIALATIVIVKKHYRSALLSTVGYVKQERLLRCWSLYFFPLCYYYIHWGQPQEFNTSSANEVLNKQLTTGLINASATSAGRAEMPKQKKTKEKIVQKSFHNYISGQKSKANKAGHSSPSYYLNCYIYL